MRLELMHKLPQTDRQMVECSQRYRSWQSTRESNVAHLLFVVRCEVHGSKQKATQDVWLSICADVAHRGEQPLNRCSTTTTNKQKLLSVCVSGSTHKTRSSAFNLKRCNNCYTSKPDIYHNKPGNITHYSLLYIQQPWSL
jgi:hypothetical protein